MKRRCLPSLVTVCAVAGVAAMAPNVAHAAAAQRVLVLGDSISQGTAGDVTWRYRLDRSLAASPAAGAIDLIGPRSSLFNVAVNKQDGKHAYADPSFDQDHDALWGRTLTGEVPLVAAALRALPSLPTVIVVELGTNDAPLGATKALDSMSQLIAQARTVAPAADFVIAEPYAPYSFRSKAYLNAAYTADFDRGLPLLAGQLDTPASRVVTADLRPDFDAAARTWDGHHPTPTGEILIARAITGALAELGVGDGYHGPASAAWPAVGPTATVTATATAGRLTVTWPDATTGALAYGLEQQHTTAAGTAGTWSRVATLTRTLRTWSSPTLSAGDTYAYRLVPVRGVMEGQAGVATSIKVTSGDTPPATTPAATWRRPWWRWW